MPSSRSSADMDKDGLRRQCAILCVNGCLQKKIPDIVWGMRSGILEVDMYSVFLPVSVG